MQPSAVSPKLRAVSPFRYDKLSDEELVLAIARGEGAASAAVWDRYATLVRSVLRSGLGFDAELEDQMQEVFLALVRRAHTLREPSALRSYLVGVAVRLLLVELRRRRIRRWVTLSPSGEVPEIAAAPRDPESAAALRGLYALLERMPDRRRLAFVLRHVEGLEVSEVASALGVSESTAKREIIRARANIFARARASEPALWEYLQKMEGEGHDHG